MCLKGLRGGGLGPKSVCTTNSPTRFSLLQILFFPTMVTLVWREGGVTLLLQEKKIKHRPE